jgi:hypothetical protein
MAPSKLVPVPRRPRQDALWGIVMALCLAACSPMPPDVDTAAYVPLTLAPASLTGVRDARGAFRQLFCHEDGVPPLTDACDAVLRRFRGEAPAAGVPVIHTELRSRYRIALVLGMGWDCMRGLIDESQLPTTRLAEYGLDTLLIEVEGLSDSARNADIIAHALRTETSGDDQRPFILIGYSKGAPDILVALQEYPELRSSTAAFVSVAGAVGGSPMAEHTSGPTLAALRHSPFGDCASSEGNVLDSLHPARRHAWLADNLPLPFPSYSLITAPEPTRVSRALRSSYKLLGAVHPINDGALLHWDQLLPGSTLLGYANADHWAVTVPIAVHDIPLGEFLISNGFPRTRLWLSIADYVIGDLVTGDLQTPEASKETAGP